MPEPQLLKIPPRRLMTQHSLWQGAIKGNDNTLRPLTDSARGRRIAGAFVLRLTRLREAIVSRLILAPLPRVRYKPKTKEFEILQALVLAPHA